MRSEKERIYDAYLVSSARAGDDAAMGQLAKRWHHKLLRHAWRLTGDRDLAADITQEAWLDILRGIRNLNNEDAFAAWAFRVVTRRSVRSLKRRQRLREVTDALASEPDSTHESDDYADQSDLATIQALIAGLPSQQRATMGLFYSEGLRIAEIAAVLDTAPGTIKTRLMHARARLRNQLKGEADEKD